MKKNKKYSYKKVNDRICSKEKTYDENDERIKD